MNIHVHIERLILDGLPVAGREGPLVQAAVAAELRRLLALDGLDGAQAGTVADLPAGAIEFSRETGSAHLGQRIACALHARLGSAPSHGEPNA